MRTSVRHSRGEYAVEVTDLKSALAQIGSDDFVVTDENVAKATGLAVPHLAVKPGEQSKSLETYGQVLEWLAGRAHRSSRVVALGGGVVGDLAGFAAATFMRGVPVLQVPTTLMAMVDSSIGGKVGIDLAAGKNLAGTFWPPAAVLVPIDSLRTLNMRHFTNGAAEVWKYGAILDAALFERLQKQPFSIESSDLAEVVFRCIELKKDVVEEDEHEKSGRRAVLNFGHTVGHAIEQALGYSQVLHGEAVAIGMVAEARLADNLGVSDRTTARQIKEGMERQGLPTILPSGLRPSDLLPAMRRDKKAGPNALAFSLVSEIGTCKLYADVPESEVVKALEEL